MWVPWNAHLVLDLTTAIWPIATHVIHLLALAS